MLLAGRVGAEKQGQKGRPTIEEVSLARPNKVQKHTLWRNVVESTETGEGHVEEATCFMEPAGVSRAAKGGLRSHGLPGRVFSTDLGLSHNKSHPPKVS